MKKFSTFILGAGLLALAACGGGNADISDSADSNGIHLYEETHTNQSNQTEQSHTADADFHEWDAAWATAQEFWQRFESGDISGALGMMTAEMQAALSVDMLDATRQNILMSQGSFSGEPIILIDTEYDASGIFPFSFMAMNNTGFGIYRIIVADEGGVEAFWIVDSGFNPAAASNNAAFSAEPITIGSGTPWELGGILTMPSEASANAPVPALVLVHGSGHAAGDMDSSLFDNRPFRDIAEYLSANGIAVIRYNKRTFTHANSLLMSFPDNLTVWEETVEDAVFAANLLRADERVDSGRIFMLGLSMGGMLAPRIHLSGGDFAGIILAGSTPYSFTDTIVQQNLAVLEEVEDEATAAAFREHLDAVIELFDVLHLLTDEQARALPFDGGATFYYLKDFNAYSFETLVPEVHVPFLVLHGWLDFQTPWNVSITRFGDLFYGRDNIQVRLYEELNHIFMQSVATGIGDIFEDYAIPGNVAPEVLRDIVEWIKEVQ